MSTPLEKLKAIFALPKNDAPQKNAYSIYVDNINNALLSGKRAKTKEELDKIVKTISDLSFDVSGPQYPRMAASEFLSGDKKQAAISPKEMLQSYYGEELPREIVAAGNYNIFRPTIETPSYARMLGTVKTVKSPDYDSSLYDIKRKQVVIGQPSQKDIEINRKWLNSDDPWKKQMGTEFFKQNSLDPTLPDSDKASTLEHEVSHHISLANLGADLPAQAYNNAKVASDGFKKFGRHTGQPHETTQALGRFQREMFKNTGKRLYPVEFMSLVNKGEIPDFLTQEGRRILIYAKSLKEVSEKSQSKKKKEAAQKALQAISRMAPAVVKNEKKYGLDLPIG